MLNEYVLVFFFESVIFLQTEKHICPLIPPLFISLEPLISTTANCLVLGLLVIDWIKMVVCQNLACSYQYHSFL